MADDKIDLLKVVECINGRLEKVEDRDVVRSQEHAVINEKLNNVLDIHKEQKQEHQILFSKVIGLEAKNGHLEQRITKHSKESKDNYDKLEASFQSLKDDISSFKGEVLKRLDINAGRDAVLKFIIGAFAGGIIMYVVDIMFNV